MENNEIEKIRHSLSHLLAMAVLEKFPKVKLGMGPSIENGFYYDFEFSDNFEEKNIKQLEKVMRKMIQKKIIFKKKILSFEQAIKLFKDLKQPFKLELIKDLKKDKKNKNVSVYYSNNFVDLCSGPHIKSTEEINPKAFKLTRIAGAYWKGNEKNKMLTRIYGIAFKTEEDLKGYEKLLEEAKKRDHRKLGKELDLFSIQEEYGPGLVYWHPKGAMIRHVIEDFWKKAHFKNGYQLVYTPHIGKAKLWQISGHLDFYKEDMYSPMKIDNQEYYIKPMNCPFQIAIYKNKIYSYRDLPLRWAELGTVYRYEMAGALHGLLRVRGFTQDDAHIICSPEQMPDELKKVVKFSLFVLKSFGFKEFKIYLSTKPKKAIGSPKLWKDSIDSLEKVLKELKIKYEIDKEEGTFYGPKIDIKIKDVLNREWQTSTIQFDFNLPEKFKMEYIGKNGKAHRPYMIHRALMGSLERFFGVMIEHYAGAFPFWLSPIQIQILPVGEKHIKFAEKLKKEFEEYDFRIEIDKDNETIGKKIRQAEMNKIPYIIVVGDKEMNSKKLAIRERGKKEIKEINKEEFIKKIEKLFPKI